MISVQETIIINGTKEATEAIRNVIDAQPDSQSQLTERRNLDGSAAAWIVIATLAAQTIPHVLGFVKDYVASRQVKKLKIGDWEVENPTPEIVERFLSAMDAQSKSKKTDD